MDNTKVVIVGGGFAGVNLALDLAKTPNVSVTLVDKNNYNFFPPLLYQVATGLLEVSSISIPFRTLFKQKKNLSFRIGELKRVNADEKTIEISTGTISYDYLVLATGTTTNFFGNKNIEEHSLPMKTIMDAIAMRNYLLRVAEQATFETDKEELAKLSNIVISGAGPAGVEVAGMLAEMRLHILEDIYPELDEDLLNIYIIDGEDAVLPPMRKESQEYAKKTLENMGIKVLLNTLVADYKDDRVVFKNGKSLPTKTLIWTAGVTGFKFDGIPDEAYTKGNRILVNEFNQMTLDQNIFVIGDASMQTNDERYAKGYPQLGSVATQQGKQLAKNIKRMLQNEPLKPFKYTDKGTMAIIGKSSATADLTTPDRTLTGFMALMAWLLIHLFLLINYRNRIQTMWDWTNAYFTKNQSQGLLIGKYADID